MRLALVFVLSVSACTRAPDWSAAPAAGVDGEATIEGEPLILPRVAGPPTIDGQLGDPAWSHAAQSAALVDPGNGNPLPTSPVASSFRATWDDKNLYLAVVVHDRAPSSPFGHDDVDPHVWSKASGIEVMLQPGDLHDNRDYYELQIDVNGAVWDTHFDDYMQPVTGQGDAKRFGHQDWQSHVERAVYKRWRDFYSVELALPWASLSPARVAVPPRPHDVWRMNVYAFRDGQRHAVAWSPLRGRGNFHKSERFGRIAFSD